MAKYFETDQHMREQYVICHNISLTYKVTVFAVYKAVEEPAPIPSGSARMQRFPAKASTSAQKAPGAPESTKK